MLVLEPKKRYKMKQIMQHKWLMADKMAAAEHSKQTTIHQHISMTSAHKQNGGGGKAKAFNEQILRLMKDMGIEQQLTIEVRVTTADVTAKQQIFLELAPCLYAFCAHLRM